MKKIILFAIFVLCGHAGYSQTSLPITFSDIVYGRTHTLPQTQEYLFLKGYKFLNKKEHIGDITQKYVFAKSPINNGVQFQVIIGNKDVKVWQVEILMENQSNFLAIKNKIKTLGYKLDTTPQDQFDNPLSEKYTKDNNVIIFSTEQGEDVGTYYYIIYW